MAPKAFKRKKNDPVGTNGDLNKLISASTSRASEMEKILENMDRTMMSLKSGESNKSVTSNKPGESEFRLFTKASSHSS